MLELKNIYAGYTEGNPILKGINLTLNEGEVVVLLDRTVPGNLLLQNNNEFGPLHYGRMYL